MHYEVILQHKTPEGVELKTATLEALGVTEAEEQAIASFPGIPYDQLRVLAVTPMPELTGTSLKKHITNLTEKSNHGPNQPYTK